MLSLSSELDFASLYEDCQTFFADETYTKIATLINFHNHFSYIRKEYLGLYIG